MRLSNVQGSSLARRRPAFTLIELLVVIAIIAILMALTAGAVFQALGQQQKGHTELLVQKVSDALNQQSQAVVDQAKKEQIQSGVYFLAGGDETRARAMWIILRLRQEFPISYKEATTAITANFGGNNTINLPPKDSYLRAIGNSAATPTESSACLVLALSEGRRGMASLNLDEALGSSAIKDTDGDGLKEIVDSWGTPVLFWRWPFGNQELLAMGGPNPRSLYDPTRSLTAPAWNNKNNSNAVIAFETLAGGFPVHQGNWTPHVFYMEMVIGSAGRNKAFGVDAGSMTMNNANQANDNIYNYRLRIGGKGD